jgi:hypothetical protein
LIENYGRRKFPVLVGNKFTVEKRYGTFPQIDRALSPEEAGKTPTY